MADWSVLPASGSVVDRRSEQQGLAERLSGLTMDEWGRTLQHPMTPFWKLFPSKFPDPYHVPQVSPGPPSQLQVAAGINDIPNNQLKRDAGLYDIGKPVDEDVANLQAYVRALRGG